MEGWPGLAVDGCARCVDDPPDPVGRRLLEEGDGVPEVELPDFIFVGVLGVGDGCLVVQDVEGRQLVEVELLEVTAQVVGPWDGGLPSR